MQSERQGIAAYFRNQDSAERAINELRSSGFRSNQIGCSFESASELQSSVGEERMHQHRTFWDKVEGFFKGEEGYEDRDTGAGDGPRNEGMRVGPTLRVPERYNTQLSRGGCLVTVHAADRIGEAEQILIHNGGEIDRDFYTAASQPSTGTSGVTGERRIRLISEVLRVNKERVQTGEVRLRKETRTEQQTVEVPVTHEELVIERVKTQGGTPATGEIGSNEEIRVPLSEERVTVDKQPVVREEVKVGKKAVQDTKHVSEQVRHEELKVDEDKRLKEEERLRSLNRPRKSA